MKKIICILLAICLILPLSACGEKTPTAVKETVEHETKFGGAYAHITIEDFLSLGYEYGDSLDVEFSNGVRYENLPFYDGYYVKAGEKLVVAYPGYPYIKICENNGEDLWQTASLSDTDTVKIALRKRGVYADVQNVMSMTYTNEYADYGTDETFANFRVMNMGSLAENKFYRGASPCDNQYNRAPYSSALCEKAGINYFINLADNTDELESYIAADVPGCEYWRSLYAENKVLPLDMAANYRGASFAHSVAEGMRAIINNDGKFYIHCTEGKDRTGFFCLLLGAFAGADRETLCADYMKTYENYYGVTKQSDPAGYDAMVKIRFDDMMECLIENLEESDAGEEYNVLVLGAESYLAFGGMTEEEIAALHEAVKK